MTAAIRPRLIILAALMALAAWTCGLHAPSPAEAASVSVSVSNVTATTAYVSWTFAGGDSDTTYRARYQLGDLPCGQTSSFKGPAKSGNFSLPRSICVLQSGMTYNVEVDIQSGLYQAASGSADFTTLTNTPTPTPTPTPLPPTPTPVPPAAGDYSFIQYPLGYWMHDLRASGAADSQGIAIGVIPPVPASLKSNSELTPRMYVRNYQFDADAGDPAIYQCGGDDYVYGGVGTDVCKSESFRTSFYRQSISFSNSIYEESPVSRNNYGQYLNVPGIPQSEDGNEDFYTYSIPSINDLTVGDRLGVSVDPPPNTQYVQLRFVGAEDERLYAWMVSQSRSSNPRIISFWIDLPDGATSYQVRGAVVNYNSTSNLTTDSYPYTLRPYRWAYTPWTGERAIIRAYAGEGGLPLSSSDNRVIDAIEDLRQTIPGAPDSAAFTPLAWGLFSIILGVGMTIAAGAMSAAKTDSAHLGLSLAAGLWVGGAAWCIGGPTLAGIEYWAAIMPAIAIMAISVAAVRMRAT